MSITIWGLFMILVAVFLLIFRGLRGFVEGLIFTSPLFITVIAPIPLGDTVLRTSYFFAIVFIVLFMGARSLKIVKVSFLKKDLYPLYFFLLVITLSIFMPFFLSGDIQVLNFNQSFGIVESLYYEPLEFRQSNLTQLIYPYFQVTLFTLLVAYFQKTVQIKRALNVLIKGSYIVLATGCLFVILISIGSNEIINFGNYLIAGSFEGPGFQGNGFMGLPRMHSWAGEPGYTSFLLLMILGLLTGPIVTNNYILGKKRKGTLILFFMVLAGVIVSSGTTGYIGLIILLVITFVSVSNISNSNFKIKMSYLVAPFALGGLILLWIFTSTGFSFLNYFQEYHLSKLTELTGSGATRFYIVKQNFLHFLESPILGIGYGSERSVALGGYLLGNTGLLGFGSFVFWGFYLMKKMMNILQSEFATHDQKTLAFGLLVSFATMFALMQFAKSAASLIFHFFWITAACMLALHRIFKKQKREIL